MNAPELHVRRATRAQREQIAQSIGHWLRYKAAEEFRESAHGILACATDLLCGEWEEDTAGGFLSPDAKLTDAEPVEAERRERIATACMPVALLEALHDSHSDQTPEARIVAKTSIRFADALIAELDKKGAAE